MPRGGWAEVGALLDITGTQARLKWQHLDLQRPATPDPQPKDPLEVEQERIERVRKLKQEQALIRDIAGERSLRAFLEHLVCETAQKFEPAPPYRARNKPPSEGGKTKATTDETMLQMFSDWHSYEEISRDGTRGFNEYNAQVMAQRVRRLVETHIDIKDRLEAGSGWRFRKLVVASNGDYVPGTIHELERHTDAPNTALAVYGTGMILAQALRDLAAQYEEVEVFCTSGNHGRWPDAKRMQQKDPLRNWDTLVTLFAREHLRETKNIKWYIPDAYSVGFSIYGWNFLQTHGHDIKCFPSNTMIQSSWNMEREIGQVQIGDSIINGRGQQAKVTDIYRRHYNGRLVNVSCEQLPKPALRCTPSHKVRCVKPQWIVDKVVPEPEWMRADYLSEGDYLAIPKPVLSESVTSIKMSDVPLHRPKHFKDRPFPDSIPVNEDLGLVLGWYLGDGSVSNNAVEVVFGPSETKWVETYRDAVERLVGIRPSILNQTKRNCHRVLVYSKALASLLLHLGGKGSRSKTLHESVFDWPLETLRMVLIGWLAADGHAYQREDRYCYALGMTSSKPLIKQMFWIAVAGGYHPALRRASHKYNGGARMMEELVFYGDEGKELGEKAKEGFTPIAYLPQRPRQLSWLDAHGFYLVKISAVSQEEYDGEVVDLTVDPDHSYIVNNLSVHNSWGGIPFYGIQRYASNINALEASRAGFINYFLVSHFHQFSSLSIAAGELFVNGSVCGGTEYTINSMGKSDRPSQLMAGVHPEHGVTHRWPIYCSTAGDAKGYNAQPWVGVVGGVPAKVEVWPAKGKM